MTGDVPAVGEPAAAQLLATGFFRRFVRLAAPYWSGEDKWRVRATTIALIALTATMIGLAIRLNLWNADLFNALEARSMDEFMVQLGVFAALVLANTLTVTTHLHLKRRLQIGWRRWLTHRVVGEWMEGGRHYQIGLMPGDFSNPDGRIAEDIRVATETAIELGHSLFYSLLLLLSFIGILWTLSGVITLPIGDDGIDVPGHMVWLALLYSMLGSWFAFLLSQPLVRASNIRQTVEADFRFALVRARESSEAIALLEGEPSERRRLAQLFDQVREIWNLQTESLWRLMAFSSTFNMLWTMLPILVSTPRYLAGSITLGGLMQTAQAFQQVTAGLSWPVDNFPKVAEWRASVERVLALHDAAAIVGEDVTRTNAHTIKVEATAGGGLAFRDVAIATPEGTALYAGINAEIQPGERVLIAGDARAAHTLFKAVAKVWPWGRGRIELPDDAAIFFVPERPYLPVVPLRAVLSYPAEADRFDPAAMIQALKDVGLDHLVPRLADSDQWDQVLDAAEQQRLGFARLLLRRPAWIFLEEATSAIGTDEERRLMQLVFDRLPTATVLTIGRHADLEALHQRKLTLERAGDGRIFVRESWPWRAGVTSMPSRAWRFLERLGRSSTSQF